MRVRKNPMTPLAAVVPGLLAGAAGTLCLDAVHYLKYRRAGGTDRPLTWGRSPSACSRASASASSPDQSAWLISTIAHWAYGSAAGAAYGILAGSLPTPHPEYGVPFGAAVFAGDYIALPAAGLYKPIEIQDTEER